eukprot:1903767-Pleurochrysis_carterae.AAC.1
MSRRSKQQCSMHSSCLTAAQVLAVRPNIWSTWNHAMELLISSCWTRPHVAVLLNDLHSKYLATRSVFKNADCEVIRKQHHQKFIL